MTDGKATERPWTLKPVVGVPDEEWWAVMTASGDEVCIAPRHHETLVNLIVRAVNAYDSNQAEIKRLQERVRELEEALRPFANGADEIPRNWPDNRGLLIDKNHPENPKSHCLLLAFVSDFRRARTALQGDKP